MPSFNFVNILGNNLVRHHGDSIIASSYINTDSRTIGHGDTFAAVIGSKFNGHDFINQAINQGATAIIHSQPLKDYQNGVSYFLVKDPQMATQQLQQHFYPQMPTSKIAVTGTNGKSSVVNFIKQFAHNINVNAATIGTIGLELSNNSKEPQQLAPKAFLTPQLTTPSALTIAYLMQRLAANNINILAMEASSHGLEQHRLEGLNFNVAAFTNLSPEHLDYHFNMTNYANAKSILFSDHLAANATVVINTDNEYSEVMIKASTANKNLSKLITFGNNVYQTIKTTNINHQHWLIKQVTASSQGSNLVLIVNGIEYKASIPLYGSFQVQNIIVAIAALVASGFELDLVWPLINKLTNIFGRMDNVSNNYQQPQIFIDFAHDAAALDNASGELRRHFPSTPLTIVFGCGGDRDRLKRPKMGKIACQNATNVIVTDDNPRFEEPSQIRQEILKGCGDNAIEIADRSKAIAHAISNSPANGIVLIAGKGHEQYQLIGNIYHDYSDYKVVEQLLMVKS
ncbi:MAG: UDP-N-acetylmuramoyl-L-alanyl-D-glutamate--2,6-diaminopimelate ligase [Pseudomonadota bacterium]